MQLIQLHGKKQSVFYRDFAPGNCGIFEKEGGKPRFCEYGPRNRSLRSEILAGGEEKRGRVARTFRRTNNQKLNLANSVGIAAYLHIGVVRLIIIFQCASGHWSTTSTGWKRPSEGITEWMFFQTVSISDSHAVRLDVFGADCGGQGPEVPFHRFHRNWAYVPAGFRNVDNGQLHRSASAMSRRR